MIDPWIDKLRSIELDRHLASRGLGSRAVQIIDLLAAGLESAAKARDLGPKDVDIRLDLSERPGTPSPWTEPDVLIMSMKSDPNIQARVWLASGPLTDPSY